MMPKAKPPLKGFHTPDCASCPFDIEEFNKRIPNGIAPIDHKNLILTDALETIADYYKLASNGGADDDFRRYEAYRKASVVLKCVPFVVTKVDQVIGLRRLGDDVTTGPLEVVKDVLTGKNNQKLSFAKEQLDTERFKCIKAFKSIYGVGLITAKKWYNQGIRTVDDAMNKREKLGYSDPRIMYGLAFYEDLQGRPLKQKDVDIYVDYIKAVLQELDKGLSLELVGGFRRGKPDGHDIDLMITHKQEGSEAGVLDKIVGIFHQNNLVMLSHIKKKGVQDLSKAEPYDSFEKLYGIYKLPNKGTTVENIEATDIDNGLGTDIRVLRHVADSKRNWRAFRMDIVVVPQSQLPYALVGWTGNNWYNRELRDYASKKKGLTLTNHGLWDSTKKKSIPAKTERDVFTNLGLDYRGPQFRNY